MKKAVYVSLIFILVIGTGLFSYFYFFSDDGKPALNANNANTTAAAPSNVNTNQSSTYIGDNFTLKQLPGWIQGHLTGTLVSFHPEHEQQPAGSAAAAINFQSYIAVSFDATGGKTFADVYQQTIDDITAAIPETTVFATSEEAVSGLPARFAAMEFTQQEVEYTVLVAVYYADERYYVVSFNTTTALWMEYKDGFYEVARSFSLKSTP